MQDLTRPLLRRESPRIDVEALCWELIDGKQTSGLAVDLSSMGLRIERPYMGGPTRREMQLELEVPGIDEIVWAKAEASSDVLIPTCKGAGGPMGLIRRTGYRLIIAAQRDLRMIREYVFETDKLRRAIEDVDDEQYATNEGNQDRTMYCWNRAAVMPGSARASWIASPSIRRGQPQRGRRDVGRLEVAGGDAVGDHRAQRCPPAPVQRLPGRPGVVVPQRPDPQLEPQRPVPHRRPGPGRRAPPSAAAVPPGRRRRRARSPASP